MAAILLMIKTQNIRVRPVNSRWPLCWRPSAAVYRMPLEQGDLNELDKILKMKEKNQDNRNGENKQSG